MMATKQTLYEFSICLFTRLMGALVLAVGFTSTVQAQWPDKPVRFVVPAPPASTTDLLARILADELPKRLGQPVIVDNRPGGGTAIGTAYVLRQSADGYTFLLTQNTLVSLVHMSRTPPYDPIKDFDPVSLIARSPLVLAINGNSSIKTVDDFITAARARNMKYGSPGIGTPQHMAMVQLQSKLGLNMTHVPYKGSGPIAVALASGELDATISVVGAVLPYIQTGRIRPLAVSDARRSSLLPDLPTVAERVPGVVLEAWYAVLAPAGSPKAVVERMGSEVSRILKDPAIAKSKLAAPGVEAVGSTPEELREVLRADMERYKEIFKLAGISPQ